MKFHCIEVSGIRTITFNRKTMWKFSESFNLWEKQQVASFDVCANTKTHEEMMAIVNVLKWDRRYRMWIHGDALNIVRKSEEHGNLVIDLWKNRDNIGTPV